MFIPTFKGLKHSQKTIEKMKLDGRKGRKHTFESRVKMSSWQEGKHHSPSTEFKRGQHYSVATEFKKGMKPSDATRKLWSKTRMGKGNPNWKGGKTPEYISIRNSHEHDLWREKVFSRDNYTCQKYNTWGGNLHPHHVLNFVQYPELRFDVNNGITLSEKAHREFHRKYGIKNNTREQLMEFLNSTS